LCREKKAKIKFLCTFRLQKIVHFVWQIIVIDSEISYWGGVSILKKMLDQSGFVRLLEQLPLPAQDSNRGYPPEQLFLLFMSGL
jgi:hypothetical protein